MSARSLPALFFELAARRGDALALRHKKLGVWQRVSWREYAGRVRSVCAALIGSGVAPGDRVAILGDNRPEWLYCHLATMAAGAATCGVYPTSAPEQVRYLLQHSEARVLFVEGEELLDKCLRVLDQTRVERVCVWDPRGLYGLSDPKVVFLDALEREGRPHAEAVAARVAAVAPERTAMIIYTSGTTGPPKGAMLSHANILFLTEALLEALPARAGDEGVSYLPFAHVFENLLSVFLAVRAGAVVNFVERPDTLFQNLREVSPTILAGVPRVWEKLASTVELRMRDSTWLKRRAYRWALSVGRRRRPGARLAWRLANALVLHPLRRRLGLERVRLATCGAAPASPELFDYFHALGVPLLEGYGQTESTGVISVNREGRARLGSVGEPLRGIQVRIADDGEILTRGPHVFQGYFKDPALSAETIDASGWLHTGDLGRLEHGALRILDRKKDIIITAGGKNVTPAAIENELKFSPYIQDAIVIGDRRRYLAALILIDEENVVRFAQERRVPFGSFAELTRAPEVVRLIDQEVRGVNARLSQVEAIKRHALLPRRFYAEDGDVTPTHKVKRRALEARYRDLIESLYAAP